MQMRNFPKPRALLCAPLGCFWHLAYCRLLGLCEAGGSFPQPRPRAVVITANPRSRATAVLRAPHATKWPQFSAQPSGRSFSPRAALGTWQPDEKRKPDRKHALRRTDTKGITLSSHSLEEKGFHACQKKQLAN
jgi:hypothetical protein